MTSKNEDNLESGTTGISGGVEPRFGVADRTADGEIVWLQVDRPAGLDLATDLGGAAPVEAGVGSELI